MAVNMSPDEEIKILREKLLQATQEITQLRQENQQMAPLTFTDLLTLYHEKIKEVPVEPNISKCTTVLESIFCKVSAIYDQCKEPPATFPCSYTISNSIKTKAGLLAVEDIVEVVIRDLIRERKSPDEFKLGIEIQIDNYANNLAGDAEKIFLDTWRDKIFIRKTDKDAKQLIVVIKYKPPHKLSIEMLKAGLKDLNPLDLIHRVKIPKDEPVSFVHNSETAVAIVISQVYTYMIDNGIQYAYMKTGEAFVFLCTREPDRKTLYYHLSIQKDASPSGTVDWISHTAIGQFLSFYILACGGKFYDQDIRNHHKEQAKKWSLDDNRVYDNMTPSSEKPETPSSNYKPRTKRHAPAHSQPRRSRRLCASTSGETPAVATQVKKDDSDDLLDSDDSRAPSASRLSKGTSSQSTTKASQTHTETSSSLRKRHESYCSHQCLLALVTNGALDLSCPNYEFRPRMKNGRGEERHAISVVQLRELLLAQIQKTMNTNIEPLGSQGSRGAIFKLTLESHGYTMIGKGTSPHYVPDLRSENAVYNHLGEIQGTVIPVCLGAIDSPRCYFYDVGVDIHYWLLMSFAGRSLTTAEFDAWRPSVDAMDKKLTEYGIIHWDISPNNILWDEQAKKLMVIDLERTTFVRKEKQKEVKKENRLQDKNVLKEMGPNKTLGKRKEIEGGALVNVKRAKLRTQ